MTESGAAGDAVRIRPMTPADWPDVERIYREGIATNDATLEPAPPPSWAIWDAGHRPDCRFVAEHDGTVVGWVALSPYSSRRTLEGVAWESVYVAESARGRGVGSRLLAAVIPASEDAGIWTLMAGIAAENAPSLALHERSGFRRVGVHERIGRDPIGRWRDVVTLERRSARVGV